jgi:hypothetical protein
MGTGRAREPGVHGNDTHIQARSASKGNAVFCTARAERDRLLPDVEKGGKRGVGREPEDRAEFGEVGI